MTHMEPIDIYSENQEYYAWIINILDLVDCQSL